MNTKHPIMQELERQQRVEATLAMLNSLDEAMHYAERAGWAVMQDGIRVLFETGLRLVETLGEGS